MFKTKRDVDRHVSHILNKIRDEKEVIAELFSEIIFFFFHVFANFGFVYKK